MVIPDGEIVYNFDYNDWCTFEDFKERHLEINCEIDEACVDIITNNILKYNREDKGVPVEDRTPIMLYINSPGGSVDMGFSCVDAIQLSKTPVYTVNEGDCMSMAFILFITGQQRFTLPHSTFLMHDGSTGYFWESMSKAKDRMEFSNQTEEKIKEHVLRYSKITEQMYDDMYRKEWYMYPEEAKKCGFVDHIVGVDCDIDKIV